MLKRIGNMLRHQFKWTSIRENAFAYILLVGVVVLIVLGLRIRHPTDQQETFITGAASLLLLQASNLIVTQKNSRKLDGVRSQAAATATIAQDTALLAKDTAASAAQAVHQTNGGLTIRLERHSDAVVERVSAITQMQLDDMRAQIQADVRQILEEDTVAVNRLIQQTKEKH